MYKNGGSLVMLPEAHSWMNLAMEYIGAYVFVFHDSLSTESSDFKSAGCQDGIFGQL